MLCCSGLQAIATFFVSCACIDGKPMLASRAIIVSAVLTIALDYLMVGPLDMGRSGVAIATAMATSVQLAMVSPYLFSRQCSISFIPSTEMVKRFLGENLKNGAPMIVSRIVIIVMTLAQNIIVQRSLGAEGIYALTISLTVCNTTMLVSDVVRSSLMTVGGFLMGQGDYQGLKILVGRSFAYMFIVSSVLTAGILLFPQYICYMMGTESPELVAITCRGMRFMMLAFLVINLFMPLVKMYQMLGWRILTPLILALDVASQIILLLIFEKYFSSDMLWYAFPLSALVATLCAVIVTEIVRRRNKEPLYFLTLVSFPHLCN